MVAVAAAELVASAVYRMERPGLEASALENIVEVLVAVGDNPVIDYLCG